MQILERPGIAQGYAKSQAQSLFPSLWNSAALFYAPSLGFQGALTMPDRSGNRRDGAMTSITNTSWIPGPRYGQALSMGSTGEYIEVASFAVNKNWSASFWLRLDITTGYEPFFSCQVSGPGTNNILFRFEPGGNLLFFLGDSSSVFLQFTATAVVAAGRWYHVGFVQDGNTIYGYLNGIRIGTATSGSYGTQSITLPFFFGRDSRGTTADLDFQGAMGDMCLWTRSLLPVEMAQLAAGATPFHASARNQFRYGRAADPEVITAAINLNAYIEMAKTVSNGDVAGLGIERTRGLNAYIESARSTDLGIM